MVWLAVIQIKEDLIVENDVDGKSETHVNLVRDVSIPFLSPVVSEDEINIQHPCGRRVPGAAEDLRCRRLDCDGPETLSLHI